NEFIKKLSQGRIKIKKCYQCLKTCDLKTTPYCISQALINSVKGNIAEGLVFAGSNAYRIDRITTVKDLINELVTEAELALG
ncbi:MAG: nitronate monooxygenase, partial [Chitinophagales bacterium]